MKTALLLSLVTLARRVVSTGWPDMQWDPETVKDCIEWYNNYKNVPGTMSCEEVRDYFNISPEEFHKWNPSVGLDCKPWDYQSYCIYTLEKVNQTATTTTQSTTTLPTTTTSVATLGPSPTAWTAMGCYVEDSKLPLLDLNMNPAGDPSLTIPKCKNSCYRRSYPFAGVQEGNQCWCGTYVGGEWTKNQDDCNIPCTGDTKTFCGGKGLLNIFRALENQAPASSTSTAVKNAVMNSVVSSTGTAVETGAVTAGAVKNSLLFGFDF